MTNLDIRTEPSSVHHPRLIVDSNYTFLDHQLIQKLSNLSKLTKIVKIDDFDQNRQFWQFRHKLINLYTGLYTNPVYIKLIKSRIYEIEKPKMSKSRFCQNWHFWHNLINLYTENSYKQSTSKSTKVPNLFKIVKIDDFEQNWRFRQFWQFHHKTINLYTGLYTNPEYPKWHICQNIEIVDFECPHQLRNTKESLPLLSTLSISRKLWIWTQKLKISDQKF